MNESEPIAKEPSPARWQARWGQLGSSPFDWLLLAGLIGLSPMLMAQSLALFSRSYLQFFPLAWIAFVALAAWKGHTHPSTSPLRWWLGFAACCTATDLAFGAFVLASPWCAQVAMLILLCGWLLVRLGGNPWFEVIGWASLLAIVTPLPGGKSDALVEAMHLSVVQSTSALLDVVGIAHLPTPDTVEVRRGALPLLEMLNGIDSFYLLATLTLIWMLATSPSLLPGLLTVASTIIVVWLAGITRLFASVSVLNQYGIDITSGWSAFAFRILIFGTACFVMGLTGRLITILFAPFPVKTINSGVFHTFFNRLVCWPAKDPADEWRKWAQEKVESPTMPVDVPRARIAVYSCAVVFAGVGIVTSMQLLHLGPWAGRETRPTVAAEAATETLTAELLPDQFQEMQLVNFVLEQADPGLAPGQHVAVWEFQAANKPVIVSVGIPFSGFQAAERSFESSGCYLKDDVATESIRGTTSTMDVHSCHLVDPLFQEVFLCYVCMDFSGSSQARGNRRGNLFGFPSQVETTFVVQLQVLGATISAEEEARFRNILVTATEKVLPVVQQLPIDRVPID